MKTFNIYEAKTNLSKLIEMVERGEEVVIARAGKPVVDLKTHVTKSAPQLGAWKHNKQVMIPDDFDDPDPEIVSMFEDSKIFPDGMT